MNVIKSVKSLFVLILILTYLCFPPYSTLDFSLISRIWLYTALLVLVLSLCIIGWRIKRGEGIARPPLNLTALFFIVTSTTVTLNAIQDLPLTTDVTTVYSAHLGPFYELIHYALVLWIIIYSLKGRGTEIGLALILIYSTLNGRLFNENYTLLCALSLVTMMNWLVEAEREGKSRFIRNPLNLPILLFMAAGVISTVNAVYVYESLQRLLRLGNWALVYFLIVHCVEEKRQINLLIFIILTMAGITSLFAILGFFNYASQAGIVNALKSRLWLVDLYPNGSATYLAAMAALAISVFIALTSKAKKAMVVLLIALLLLCLVTTYSRAGGIGLLCGVAAMLSLGSLSTGHKFSGVVEQAKRMIKSRGKLLFLFAMLLLPLIVLLCPKLAPLAKTAEQGLLDIGPMVSRSVLWKIALNVIAHHPIWGVGVGNRFVYARYTQELTGDQLEMMMEPVIFYGSHNLFLEIGEGIGLLGLGIFVWLLITLAKYGFSLIRNSIDHYHRWLLIGLLAGEAALLTAMMFDLSLPSRTLLPFTFWAFMGLMGAMGKIGIEKERLNVTEGLGEEVEIKGRWQRVILVSLVIAAGLFFVIRPDIAARYYRRGVELQNERQFDQAMADLNVAKKLEPMNAFYFAYAGDAYLRAGLMDKALIEYQRAEELNPLFYGYHTKLGWLHWHENMFERAVADFEKAVELNPIGAVDGKVFADLGLAYAAAGRYREAMDMFKKAIRYRYYDLNEEGIWQTVEIKNGQMITILDRTFTNYGKMGYIDRELEKRIFHRLGRAGYDEKSFDSQGLDDSPSEVLFLDTVLQDLHADYLQMLPIDSRPAKRGLFKLERIYRERQMDSSADRILAELRSIGETGDMTKPENVRFHFKLGEIYLERGMLDEALEEFQKVTSVQGVPELYLRLGQVYWKKGMAKEAIANLEKFVTEGLQGRLGPQFQRSRVQSQLEDAYSLLTDAYLLEGELDKSLSAMEKAGFFGGYSVPYTIKMGELYHRQGNYERAIEEYLRALRIVSSYQQHSWRQELLVDLAEHSSEAYHAQGVAAPEAVAQHEAMVRAQPGDLWAHLYLGFFYAGQGRLDKAIEAHQQAVMIAPQNILVHLSLGHDYEKDGDVEKAMIEYQKAIELGAQWGRIDGHTALGRLYLDQGMMEAAIAEFKKAIEIQPGNVNPYLLLAGVYWEQKMLDQALAEYERAVKVDPFSVPARLILAKAYQGQGMIEEAMAALERAIKVSPDSAQPHIQLGHIYRKEGRLDEAMAQYEEAVQVDPFSAQAHIALGHLYKAEGEWEEALAEYKKALRIDPDNERYRLALCVFCQSLGIEDETCLRSSFQSPQ